MGHHPPLDTSEPCSLTRKLSHLSITELFGPGLTGSDDGATASGIRHCQDWLPCPEQYEGAGRSSGLPPGGVGGKQDSGFLSSPSLMKHSKRSETDCERPGTSSTAGGCNQDSGFGSSSSTIAQREQAKSPAKLVAEQDRCETGTDQYRPTMTALSGDGHEQVVLLRQEPRQYQLYAYNVARERNTILYLSTGMGKTLVAVLLLKHIMNKERRKQPEERKISLFLVNLVPLVDQQSKVIQSNSDLNVLSLSGAIVGQNWKVSLWRSKILGAEVIVSTAQVIKDFLAHGVITFDQISLIVFDECHHTSGKHPYARIMQDHYHRIPDEDLRPRILGLTASPVKDKCVTSKKLRDLEVILDSKIIFAEKYASPEFTKNVKTSLELYTPYSTLDIPFRFRHRMSCLGDFLDQLPQRRLFIEKTDSHAGHLAQQLGFFAADVFNLRIVSAVVDYHHTALRKCVQLPGTDSNELLRLCSVYEKLVKRITQVLEEAKSGELDTSDLLSDKFLKLADAIGQRRRKTEHFKAIVFVERRVTCSIIGALISAFPHLFPGIKHGILLGSSGSTSFNNCEPEATESKPMILRGWSRSVPEGEANGTRVLREFKQGDLNLLVSTSVGEEGLDVSRCGHVFRFDLPTNVRSFLQSRGRARMKNSEYILFLENGGGRLKQFAKIARMTYGEAAMATFQEQALQKSLHCVEAKRRSVSGHPDDLGDVPEDCYVVKVPISGLEYLSRDYTVLAMSTPDNLQYRVSSTGATILALDAKSLLSKYCQTLPGDEFWAPKPEFQDLAVRVKPSFVLELLEKGCIDAAVRERALGIQKNGHVMFVAEVKLPFSAHAQGPFVSLPKLDRLSAQRDAALVACRELHAVKALDDNLYPVWTKSRFRSANLDEAKFETSQEMKTLMHKLPDIIEDLGGVDTESDLVKLHPIPIPESFISCASGKLLEDDGPDPSYNVFVTAFYLSGDPEGLDGLTQSREIGLEDPQQRKFNGVGLITREPLSRVPGFQLHRRLNVSVPLTVMVETIPEPIRVSACDLDKVRLFHQTVCGFAVKAKDCRLCSDDFHYLFVPLVTNQQVRDQGSGAKAFSVDKGGGCGTVSVDWEKLEFLNSVSALGKMSAFASLQKIYGCASGTRFGRWLNELLLISVNDDETTLAGRLWRIVGPCGSGPSTPLETAEQEIPNTFGEGILPHRIPEDMEDKKTMNKYYESLIRSRPQAILAENSTFKDYGEILKRLHCDTGQIDSNQRLLVLASQPAGSWWMSGFALSPHLEAPKTRKDEKLAVLEHYRFVPLFATDLAAFACVPIIISRAQAALLAGDFLRRFPLGISLEGAMECLCLPGTGFGHSFERLEFLGDSVLNFVTTIELFTEFPKDNEGALTRRRDLRVRNLYLQRIGYAAGLPRFISAKGWSRRAFRALLTGHTDRQRIAASTMSDVVEALIGVSFHETGSLSVAFNTMKLLGLPVRHESLAGARDALLGLYTSPEPLSQSQPLDDSGDVAVDCHAIAAKICHMFRDSSEPVLREAFCHVSSSSWSCQSYQRLEWLGDSILNLCATRHLFNRFPDLDEGGLTDLKHITTSNSLLGVLAAKCGLHRHLNHRSDQLRARLVKFSDVVENWAASGDDGPEQTVVEGERSIGAGGGLLKELDELLARLRPYQDVLDKFVGRANGMRNESMNVSSRQFSEYATFVQTLYHTMGIGGDSKVLEAMDDPDSDSGLPPKVLGDIVESLIAAVGIDLNLDMDNIQMFFEGLFGDFLKTLSKPANMRFRALRLLHQQAGRMRCGKVSTQLSQPDHGGVLRVTVKAHDAELGVGVGRMEIVARMRAAFVALETMQKLEKEEGLAFGLRKLGCDCGLRIRDADDDSDTEAASCDHVSAA